MSKTVLAVLVPFCVVAGSAIGLAWWDRGALPGFNPTPHPVEIAQVTRDHRGVRLTGTAHYEVRLRQKMEGGDVFSMFPLMKSGDTMSREIKVLVRTPRSPEDMVTYEDMVVDGLALPPGRLVSPDVRDKLEEGGYLFAEDFVLVEAFAIKG
jgi:hypothetical protein